jgi:hypothetical protein
MREEPVTFLRHQSLILKRISSQMTARRPNALTVAALDLAEHLKLTTGEFHDPTVCRILDAVYPRTQDRVWTTGMLEQFRVRQKRQPRHLQMSTDISDMIDAEVRVRQSTIARPKRSTRRSSVKR